MADYDTITIKNFCWRADALRTAKENFQYKFSHKSCMKPTAHVYVKQCSYAFFDWLNGPSNQERVIRLFLIGSNIATKRMPIGTLGIFAT